jgi:hypothetical protein
MPLRIQRLTCSPAANVVFMRMVEGDERDMAHAVNSSHDPTLRSSTLPAHFRCRHDGCLGDIFEDFTTQLLHMISIVLAPLLWNS